MNQTGRKSRRGWMVVALLAAAMLYVLSFGPAVWLADRDLVNRDAVARLHLPLLRLCFLLPKSAQRPLRWYTRIGISGTSRDLGDPDHALWDLWLRSRMSDASYPVGDVAFRLDDGRRSFETEPLIDFIQDRIELVSWDYAGGPASIQADAATETLTVRQTAEGHAGVRAHLEQLRATQRSLAPGRKRDLPALYRALNRDEGIVMLQDVRTNAVVIDGFKLSVDGERHGDLDALIATLNGKPRTAFGDGILLRVISKWDRPPPHLVERLTDFCQTRDVDLLIHWFDYQVNWVVRASDSVYEE